MHRIVRWLFIALGTVSVALAVIGMFVPVLPTTPLLLLAAGLYARSSDRFLQWLLNNRWFGAYIRDYRAGKGMPRTTKMLTLLALWFTLGISAAFAVSSWWIRVLLGIVGLGVTIHLLRMKTYDPRSGARQTARAPMTSHPADDP